MQDKLEVSKQNHINPASQFSSAAGAACYITQLSPQLFLRICTSMKIDKSDGHCIVKAACMECLCRCLYAFLGETMRDIRFVRVTPPEGKGRLLAQLPHILN